MDNHTRDAIAIREMQATIADLTERLATTQAALEEAQAAVELMRERCIIPCGEARWSCWLCDGEAAARADVAHDADCPLSVIVDATILRDARTTAVRETVERAAKVVDDFGRRCDDTSEIADLIRALALDAEEVGGHAGCWRCGTTRAGAKEQRNRYGHETCAGIAGYEHDWTARK
jgi:hypothetical protein